MNHFFHRPTELGLSWMESAERCMADAARPYMERSLDAELTHAEVAHVVVMRLEKKDIGSADAQRAQT